MIKSDGKRLLVGYFPELRTCDGSVNQKRWTFCCPPAWNRSDLHFCKLWKRLGAFCLG